MKKVRGQIVYAPEDRIRRLVRVDAVTGCWNWQSTTRGGYGRLMVGSRVDGSRKSVSAHRYAYECFVTAIPDGMEICHRCDNRRCCNPAHLFAGTRQDNVDDREAKGRGNYSVGERVWTSKLLSDEVIAARRLRANGHTFKSIADGFGVHKKTIMDAISGKHWAHLPAPPADGGER